MGYALAVKADELEELRGAEYTPEQILEGLAVLALNGGNCARAGRQLDITDTTLLRWREKYPNRYRQACVDLAPQIEAAVVDAQRELALRAARAAAAAVELEEQRIDAGEVKDASTSARNLATTAGIAVDKVLNMTGRPNQITEVRTADQALRRLEALARTVDSTATEEPAGTEGGGGVPADA